MTNATKHSRGLNQKYLIKMYKLAYECYKSTHRWLSTFSNTTPWFLMSLIMAEREFTVNPKFQQKLILL